jgi:hypothetical protein
MRAKKREKRSEVTMRVYGADWALVVVPRHTRSGRTGQFRGTSDPDLESDYEVDTESRWIADGAKRQREHAREGERERERETEWVRLRLRVSEHAARIRKEKKKKKKRRKSRRANGRKVNKTHKQTRRISISISI